MITNIRQGIISAQTSEPFLVLTSGKVNINVDLSPLTLTFAYGSNDYLFTETTFTIGAWGPFQTGINYWLYWDIDMITGIRTFGSTNILPLSGAVLPTSNISVDQHFFDLSTKKMKVWNGRKWSEKLRVFAAQIQNGTILLPYTVGTSQVGLNSLGTAGYILFDQNQLPIKAVDRSGNNYFITSETLVHSQFDPYNSYKISATINSARAIEPIPAYHAVCFKGTNQLGIASNVNFQYPCAGISLDDFGKDESKKFITDGFITNANYWNFSDAPSTPLFVAIDGSLTTKVPQSYSLQKVGYVVSPDTVFIDIQEIILIDQFIPIVPSATPTNTPTTTPVPSSTMTPTPTPTVTPTPSTVAPTLPPFLARLNCNGSVDETFNDLHFDNAVYSHAYASYDDYLVGNFDMVSSLSHGRGIAITSSGIPDLTVQSFNVNGNAKVVANINNKLYVGGYNGLFRYFLDGSLDTSFSAPTSGNNELQISTIISSTGEGNPIFIGGGFTALGSSNNINYFAELQFDGTIEDTYDSSFVNKDVNVAVQTSDGNIYIGGFFTGFAGSSTDYIGRLDAYGMVDSSFPHITFDGPVYAIYETTDSKIYIGGDFSNLIDLSTSTPHYYPFLARLNGDGTIDTTFTSIIFDGRINTIYQSNNDSGIYVGGAFGVVNGDNHNYIAKLNSDGTYDSTFVNPQTVSGMVNTIYEGSGNCNIYIGSNGIDQAATFTFTTDGSQYTHISPSIVVSSLCSDNTPADSDLIYATLEWEFFQAPYVNGDYPSLTVDTDRLCMDHYSTVGATSINNGNIYFDPTKFANFTEWTFSYGNGQSASDLTDILSGSLINCQGYYLILKLHITTSDSYIRTEKVIKGTNICS